MSTWVERRCTAQKHVALHFWQFSLLSWGWCVSPCLAGRVGASDPDLEQGLEARGLKTPRTGVHWTQFLGAAYFQ